MSFDDLDLDDKIETVYARILSMSQGLDNTLLPPTKETYQELARLHRQLASLLELKCDS